MQSSEPQPYRYQLPQSVPLPSHRHATPSGPWPWMDLESEETNRPPRILPCQHENCDTCPQWLGYPQSHFPNWTPDQVLRCKILPAITERQHDCKIYHIDIRNERGKFAPCDENNELLVTKTNERELWNWLQIKVSCWKYRLCSHFSHSPFSSQDRLDCVSVHFFLRTYQALCYRSLDLGERCSFLFRHPL